jgi:hypothetical protein
MSWDGRDGGWTTGGDQEFDRRRREYPDGKKEPRMNVYSREYQQHLANGGTAESYFEDRGLGEFYACTMGTCQHPHHTPPR